MLRSLSTVFLTLTLIFVISCAHERLRQNEVDPWLNARSGTKPPEIDVTPSLLNFRFGGSLPWWEGNSIQLQCPDPENLITLRLERSKRA